MNVNPDSDVTSPSLSLSLSLSLFLSLYCPPWGYSYLHCAWHGMAWYDMHAALLLVT
jgi:hypothetical protein